MRALTFAICGLALLGATELRADECPGNPDALGTSRTIAVDPTEHPGSAACNITRACRSKTMRARC